MKKSLRERVAEFEILLPLMEGREKGDMDTLVGSVVTICDFGFLPDEKKGDYVAFVAKEDPKRFYFGGLVLTKNMHQLEDEGYGDEIRADGLPVRFTQRKSKNKDPQTGMYQKYTACEFYPEV